MKKHLLSLLALCLMGVSGVQAQSEVTLAGKSAEGPSVAKAPVSARAPKLDSSKTCNPATSDPAIIAGSWRAVDNSALLLTEDGKATVSGNSAVTDFEYFPYRGDLVLLNADGAVVQNYHVLRLSKDYLVFRLVGGSYAVYYPSDRFVASFTISDTDVELRKGDTHKLTVEPSPSEGILPALVWTSSDPKVASVSADGVVTALAAGTITITVGTSDGTLSVSCSVVVKDYEYVDLGLPSGTLWATYNVGASSPEDNGDYFAWGETTTKSSYTWENYKYCKGTSDSMTKYCMDEAQGVVDGLTSLSTDDDAAYQTWGENWRMPRTVQFEELYNSAYTTVEWIELNGKGGHLITSKINGNTLFLPNAGYSQDGSYSIDGWGYYWSRNVYEENDVYYCAHGLNIGTTAVLFQTDYYQHRYMGLSVRPVYEDAKANLPKMDASELTLHVGDTHQLTVSSPLYNIPSNSVDWTSSNSAVATVGQFGLVTALMPGTCTITASAKGGGWSVTCDIVVKDYEYVDLGLPSRTLWGTCNVGASSPEDYGDYFAWGETTTKSEYTWDNYFDSENNSPVFFYTFYHGTRNDKLGLTELGDTYDAAYNNWCANWHMPTAEQASELFAKCTWKWNKEKLGYDVVGPNGNAIFLPTAGYYDGASCSESTKKGYFWTRSLTPVYSGYADIISIASNQHEKRSTTRNWGLPIRPVYEKAKDTTPSLNASELTLHVGDTHLLKVTSPLYDIPSNSINWTSSNSGVASVSQFGLVTALKPGTCTITASAKGGGWSLTCDIVVKDQVNKTFTVNGVNFDMKLVEAGTFMMGSEDGNGDEKPVHSVTISKDYYIGETEVTQGLWYAVMGQKPTSDGYQWKSKFGLGDNYPAYYISWDDCQEFITKLNELTGQTFRMPTEAEWEFAARGGNMSQGYTYSGSNTIDEVAWYSDNSYDMGEESPDYGSHPVATKKANELGLYDMSGNVWEWCNDWYDYDYGNTAVTDPAGATSGSGRVIRGGTWYFDATYGRTAFRNYTTPTVRYDALGFRLALSPSKE